MNHNAELSPELELLILSARQHTTDYQSRRIQELIAGKLDWNVVLERGGRLGVQGLLRRHLRAACVSDIPDAVLEFLDEAYRYRAAANLRVCRQLQEIEEALKSLNVDIVLLKGAFLARWVYEDPALRPMSDLDFLCREEDFEIISQGLRRLGYEQQATAGDLNPFCSQKTFKRPNSLAVELHLNLECGVGTVQAIKRSESLSPESPFLTLSFSDMVEYLVAHLAHHARGGITSLIWFADIHEAAAKAPGKFEENAERLARQAGRSLGGAAVWSFLTKHWLGFDTRRWLGQSASHAFIVDLMAGNRRIPVLRYLDPVRNVWQYPGALQKIRYLRWLIFPPPHYLVSRGQLAPGDNVYLHYVKRGCSLPLRAVRSALAARRANSHGR